MPFFLHTYVSEIEHTHTAYHKPRSANTPLPPSLTYTDALSLSLSHTHTHTHTHILHTHAHTHIHTRAEILQEQHLLQVVDAQAVMEVEEEVEQVRVQLRRLLSTKVDCLPLL